MPAPVNVAPLILGDNYDAVVPVTSDTSLLTQAELTNTVVSLGNRIEYIYRRSPDLALKPEQLFTFREDFMFGQLDSTNKIVHADKHWNWTITGPASVSFSAGQGKNPGTLDLVLNGASSQDLRFRPLTAGTEPHVTGANLEQLTVVAKINDNASNTLSSLLIGLSNSSTGDQASLFYTASDKTQWKYANNGPGPLTTTNILPLVMGEYIVLDVKKNAAGDMVVSANGAVATTIAAANKPAGPMTIEIGAHHDNTDPGPFLISVDFVYVRALIPTRAGV